MMPTSQCKRGVDRGIGLRLMLTNLLKPIAIGQKITPEIFDAIMAEVRKTKREIAVEVQRQAEGM